MSETAEGFFSFEESTGAGYKGGSDKNLSDIEKYVLPRLKAVGFDYVMDKQDNTSNKVRLFAKGDKSKFLRTQVIVIDSIYKVDTRANSNINNKLVDSTLESERVHAQWKYLQKEDVHLLLFAKQGPWFILIRYDSIPEEHYALTYRAKVDRKNRIYIPGEHLPRFHRIEEFKEILNHNLNENQSKKTS